MSVDICKKKCNSITNCKGFVTDGKTCWFKSDAIKDPYYAVGKSFYYTGKAVPAAVEPRKYNSFASTNYPKQGDIKTVTGNVAKCQTVCDYTKECTGFTTDGKTCTLKKKDVKTPTYDTGITYYYTGTAPAKAASVPSRAYTELKNTDYSPGDLNLAIKTETGTAEAWGPCLSGDDCPPDYYCRVGDKRCLTDADCNWANTQDKTTRDCTKMPKSQSGGSKLQQNSNMMYTADGKLIRI